VYKSAACGQAIEPPLDFMKPDPIANPTEQHDNNFDFLRFVLASLVVFYHCFPLLYGQQGAAHHTLEPTAQYGAEIAVDFFFIISGYLITNSWERSQKAGSFLRKRILRIFPAFICSSLFCALLAGPMGAANRADYWHALNLPKFFAYLVVFVSPVIPPTFQNLPLPFAVNNCFWTLRYEFECYLLVLLFGLMGLTRKRSVVLGAFGVLLLVNAVQNLWKPILPFREYHLIGNPSYWCRLLPFFVAGMVSYLYRHEIRRSRILFVVSVLLIVVTAIFYPPLYEVLLPVCGAYATLFFAFTQRIRLQKFARYGDFSYGIYVYGFPIQQLIVLYYGDHLTVPTFFAVAFTLTLLTAICSWLLIERPSLRLKPSFTLSKRADLSIGK
jgi:peptidoglycan/LPS O-acetylase OafA/YrhL